MRLFSFIFLFFISTSLWSHNDVHQHLIYIENKGQWHENILFKTDIVQGAIFLEKTKLTVHVRENHSHKFAENVIGRPIRGQVYTVDFVGANPNSLIVGAEKRSEYFNYFIGNDASKWKGNCAGFEEIFYKNIYPHIDLKINSKNFQPKYTFVLSPGAKISDIKMKFSGLSSIELDTKGDLISKTVLGEIKDEKPISFLYSGGDIKTLESQFILKDSIITFEVKHDLITSGQRLEIDPQIIFSSYSGSTADNFGSTATYDNAGNLYGSGTVFGQGYVTTTGAYQTTFSGNSDIAITKFSPTGNARLFSTYIGGSSYDLPHSLIVDQNNRLVMLGTTSSSNFPTTTGAYKTSFAGGPGHSLASGIGVDYVNGADIVVTKFNASGTSLVGSTFFGGNGTDGVGDNTTAKLVKNYGDMIRGEVELDTLGNIYIASLSTSTNLPALANSAKSTNSGGYDGILVKFNTNLTTLLGFTYVGGTGDDALYDMCFDDAGNIVAAGGTMSTNLNPTSGVINMTYGGNVDGMVVSYTNNMSVQRFSSYYGTADYDQVYFVETDKANKIYVFGQTNHASTNYFLLGAGFSNPHKGQFVSILNPTMTTKIKSTTFGSANQDPDISPTAFLVDYCDKIFITGWGSNLFSSNAFALSTSGLPITANALQSSTNGNGFYLSILEGDLSAQYYGSFFGGVGSTAREHVDGGTSRFDKNGIVYHAVCAGCGGNQNFPIYPNAASVVGPSNNSTNCNLGVFKFDFGLPVNADFTFNPSCSPANVLFTNLSHTVSPNSKFFWLFGNGVTSILKDPTVTFSSPGIYTARLIIEDSLSCNIRDTMIKSVIILGNLADTLSDKVICPGSSVKIGFSGIIDTGLSINWSPTSSLDDPTILSPFASPATTTTYRLILVKTGCTDTFYQKVIVEIPKILAIKGDSIACLNSLTPFTCDKYTGGSYDWLPKSILTSSNKDTGRYTFTSLPMSISVTYTSPNGCLSSATKNIKLGLPTMKLTGDSIACKGDIVTIIKQSNMPNNLISFIPSSSVLSFIADTVKVKVDTSMKFHAIISISASCSARDSISFKLLKDKINWTVDSIVCTNQPINATAISHPDYSYTWQPFATLTSTQGTSPATFNISNQPRYISIHAIHAKRPNCQFHDSARIKFIDTIIKLRADTTKCRDSSVTIYHGNTKGTIKSWTPAALLISQTDSTATFKVTNSRFFRLTINDNSCTRSDSIFVRVINDFVKIQGDTIVCPKDTATIQVTNMTGASYTWLPNPLVISGTGTASVKVRVNSPQWFYVHVQDTNQCYIIDSFFINNYDSTQTVKSDFSSNTNCQNLVVNFTNKSRTVGASPTYLWDFAGQGTSTALNPNFNFTSSGLKSVKLIVNDAASCNLTDTITKLIYILQNSKATLPEIKSCKGDTVHIGLESMVDNLATISWTPSAGLINASTFYPKIRLYSTIIFTGIISKNGCQDTLTQKVNIDSPNAIKLRGDTIACLNSELLFTTDKYNVGNYFWSPFATISYQNRDTAKMIITSNNQKIKVTYISDYGCISPDSLVVKTMATALNLQMDSLGCKNESLTVKYKPMPPGGVLTYNPSANLSVITDSSLVYTVDTTKLFSIQYKINNACIANQTINFKLLKDAVNWKTDTITCRNSTVVATANINSRWVVNWTPPTLLQTPQGASPARFGNFALDNKVFIQSTLSSRPTCSMRDSALIRVFQGLVKISGRPSNCKDSFITLSASLVPGAIYTWTPINALFNSNANLATFKTDISRYYYVSANFNGQCSAIDSHFVMTGNPNLKLFSDTIICTNDTVTLNATLLPSASYLWSNGAITNMTRVTVTTPTVYYLNVVDSNNCKLRDSLNIKLFNASTMRILKRDSIVCKFDTVNLEVNNLPNVTYAWAPSSVILSGNGTNKIKAWINQNTLFYINAFLNRGIGCNIIDSIGMIKDTQYLKISGNRLVCKGDTLTLTANSNSNFVYNWKPTNWVLNQGALVKYKIVDSSIVYCSANSNLYPKCIYRDSVKVDYSRDIEKLKVYADPDRVEYGSSTTLHAVAPNIIDYFWSPPKTLNNRFIPSPTAKPDTTTTYYVQIQNNLGCRGGDSVVVTVFYETCGSPEIYIPTGFTPNRDGKNDALYVRGDNILRMHLVIYDRWGQLIFESNNQKKGWDGTYKGVELEPTVYAYYLTVDCVGGASYSQKGNITLIK